MTFNDDSTSLELNKSTSPRSLRFTLGWHSPAPGSPPAVLNRIRDLANSVLRLSHLDAGKELD